MTDPEFPRSYKEHHGAPHHVDPGPWPYLAVLLFAAIAAVAILVASYL